MMTQSHDFPDELHTTPSEGAEKTFIRSRAPQFEDQDAEDQNAFCNKVANSLRDAKEKFAYTEQLAIGKVQDVADAVDTFVYKNPWQAVGIAAAAGVLIGLLISRR